MGRPHSGDHRSDVFPGLSACVSCGAITGIILAVMSHGPESLHVQIASSAALGAILGLFVGLGRGV
jgi:hypothetical protein